MSFKERMKSLGYLMKTWKWYREYNLFHLELMHGVLKSLKETKNLCSRDNWRMKGSLNRIWKWYKEYNQCLQKLSHGQILKVYRIK